MGMTKSMMMNRISPGNIMKKDTIYLYDTINIMNPTIHNATVTSELVTDIGRPLLPIIALLLLLVFRVLPE